MRAAEMAQALGGGYRAGVSYLALCPSHDDHQPSLAIRDAGDGRILVRCHAGCSQEQVVAALRARGLWPGGRSRMRSEPVRGGCVALANLKMPREKHRSYNAVALWRFAAPSEPTIVCDYLAHRGITLALPPALRFHPELRHPSGGCWPAMIALVTRGTDNEPIGVHRTFLTRDGRGKAPVSPAKMMLGPCRGGAVRLRDGDGPLLIGEGIETTLSVAQTTGHPAWAALSTSGLKALDLPDDVVDVIILADGDDAGANASRVSAIRWRREGRRVRIARAPRGKDFNDLLIAGADLAEVST